MCVNWAGPDYPNIWSNIILDVPVKMIFRWDNVKISRHWVNKLTLHNMSRSHPTVDGLNRTRLTSPEQEVILPADCLWILTTTLLWVYSLLVYPVDFGHAPSNCVSQYIYIYIYIFICFVSFLFLEILHIYITFSFITPTKIKITNASNNLHKVIIKAYEQ